MSKETLDQFIQKVTDDEQLQARIGEEIDIDSLIALGTEHGFEFTAEDLGVNVELSDEELDGVAGGAVSIDTKAAPFKQDGTKYRLMKHSQGMLMAVMSTFTSTLSQEEVKREI